MQQEQGHLPVRLAQQGRESPDQLRVVVVGFALSGSGIFEAAHDPLHVGDVVLQGGGGQFQIQLGDRRVDIPSADQGVQGAGGNGPGGFGFALEGRAAVDGLLRDGHHQVRLHAGLAGKAQPLVPLLLLQGGAVRGDGALVNFDPAFAADSVAAAVGGDIHPGGSGGAQ